MRSKLLLVALTVLMIIFHSAESKMTMEQIKNMLKPYKNSCIKKISPDLAMVEGTKSGAFPDDPTLKCFIKCVLSMMKILKNNDISLPMIMQQIDIMMPDDHVDEMRNICTKCHAAASAVDDICEKAYIFTSCIYRENSELYFFP